MKRDLIIIGASGHGKVVADIAIKMNCWESIFFLDENENLSNCLGFKVIGKTSDAPTYRSSANFFVAIGSNVIRKKVLEELEREKLELVTLIHPSAIIGTGVEIGKGTAVMAGVVINSGTKIGRGCILNTLCSIDHDNTIEDFVHISPRTALAGTVKVGLCTWIGIGAVVSNNINICKNAQIGAGGVVVKDINEAGTYVGVPVRRVSG